MKAVTRVMLLLLALAYALASDGSSISAEAPNGAGGRIRFRITAVAESNGLRKVVSDATVEGPPGTDFDVSLRGERFRMSARFLTDLEGPASLKVRAKLETRRFYGYSEQNLPLYEEDRQEETLGLGFDESVVLLPFGKGGGPERLKIEITPEAVPGGTTPKTGGEAGPLLINILEPSPDGSINIEARKVPHRFSVEASLLEDGREVARGASPHLLEEAGELFLRPLEGAGPEVSNNPLAVRLAVKEYARGRRADLVTIGFDLHRMDPRGVAGHEALGMNWAGVGELGSHMTYDLSKLYMKDSGRKYELRFKIMLAEGERAD